MQVLQAGNHRLIFLEIEPDLVARIAKQAGFACVLRDSDRTLLAELTLEDHPPPLLLFDAADPANLGWFSRCQFYVDGQTGSVLQTPISIANQADRTGKVLPHSLRLQIAKELPANFRLPGKQPVSEQHVYGVLASLLNALVQTGVAVCGGSVIKPLAGRTDGIATRH